MSKVGVMVGKARVKARVKAHALVLALLPLGACSSAQVGGALARLGTDGQLFCAVAAKDGPVVVGLIDAGAPLAGVAAPAVVLAVGATKAYVDAACAAAGGIPVSPPAGPAPQVAIVPPSIVPPSIVPPSR
jgi:hypothetical protein